MRDAAKEDFLDVYAQVAARVKAEFPRDRVMQDLFFDTVWDDEPAGEEGSDDEDVTGAPGALPAAGGPAKPG